MIDDLQATLETLDSRHAMGSDELTKYLYENFAGSLLSLKQLQPLIAEVLRRFKQLPRKQSVDGTYPTIAGYRSFGVSNREPIGWCQGVLHRNARTVRYMLAGGNKAKSQPKKERVSVDAVAILKYLDEHISELDGTQQKILARGLTSFLTRLKRNIESCEKKNQ
jgi:hypothetical protein